MTKIVMVIIFPPKNWNLKLSFTCCSIITSIKKEIIIWTIPPSQFRYKTMFTVRVRVGCSNSVNNPIFWLLCSNWSFLFVENVNFGRFERSKHKRSLPITYLTRLISAWKIHFLTKSSPAFPNKKTLFKFSVFLSTYLGVRGNVSIFI
jgi:hypothetical protein